MDEIEPIWVDWPHARIRRELRADSGTVSRFLVQLEYDPDAHFDGSDSEVWHVVARFDHDATTGGGHDVTDEGLHLDIYREGERYFRVREFPTLQTGVAMRYCEAYLLQHGDRLLARFKLWHDFDGP